MDTFSLRWKDYPEVVLEVFQRLRGSQDYTDVTLLSSDNQAFEAHKIILGSSSPFFRNAFNCAKGPNLLLFLKGIKGREIRAILDFIYKGEAHVEQDWLDNFLKSAQNLQLKGLEAPEPEDTIQ